MGLKMNILFLTAEVETKIVPSKVVLSSLSPAWIPTCPSVIPLSELEAT